MKLSLNQRGSSHLVMLLGVAILAVVVLAGYRVMSHANQGSPASTTVSAKETRIPNDIKTSADISKAQAALETTDVDKNVNPEQLDGDLNAVL